MTKFLSILLATVLLSGCANNNYKTFYTEFVDPKTHPSVTPLRSGETPELYTSKNLDQDILTLRSKGYTAVGESAFNAGYEDPAKAIEQAKFIGASIILVNSAYTNTETSTTSLLLPNNRTTYFPGGTATTYGTMVVPMSSNTRRYDQFGIYFAKLNGTPRYGIQGRDLTVDLRRELGRNTGMLIEVVGEDTPVFYANVIAGDVLIRLDGKPVLDREGAIALLGAVPESADIVVMTVVRNGEEKDITVKLEP